MDIAINLNDYKCPVVDIKRLINNYGPNREIGVLKINPERLPMVMSEEYALQEIDRFKDRRHCYSFFDGHYGIIFDSKAALIRDGQIALTGNAYIVRRQCRVNVGLTAENLIELFNYFEDIPGATIRDSDTDVKYDALLFEYDEEKRCWR